MEKTTHYAQEDILKIMYDHPMFRHFSTYEKRIFAGFQQGLVSFNLGAEILVEGKACTCFYILLSGMVVVVKKDVEISYLEGGEIFGEMGFLSQTVRSTSVRAVDTVLAFKVNREFMGQLSSEIREKIKDYCIFTLVERIEKTSSRLQVRLLAHDV